VCVNVRCGIATLQGAFFRMRDAMNATDRPMVYTICPAQSRCDGSPGAENGRKSPFGSHFYLKTNILPRQARDRHRKN
jgi:hypothetical protein